MNLHDKHVLVTGGTGSLGKTVVKRLLSMGTDAPHTITVFSRDEAKQHYMRLELARPSASLTAECVHRAASTVRYSIGNIRDIEAVKRVLRGVDVVINAAALKQVPACESFPTEAVKTNINGAENVVSAIRDHAPQVQAVVGISTDKACKPINVMGMTKAVMERMFIEGNVQCPDTRFNVVRYGNVISSRGSVVPLFRDQIKHGGPVTITTMDMTRFLLTLEQAAETVIAALNHGRKGETFVPQVDSARIVDLARVMIGENDVDIIVTGIRPGEKIHEIMVSDEERYRTTERAGYYVIQPMLAELEPLTIDVPVLDSEYSSSKVTLEDQGIVRILHYAESPATHEVLVAA